MKKFTKMILIIAAVCFALGSVITVAASSLGGRVPVRVAMNDDTMEWWCRNVLYRVSHGTYGGDNNLAVHGHEEEHHDSVKNGSSQSSALASQSGGGADSQISGAPKYLEYQDSFSAGINFTRLEIKTEAAQLEIAEGPSDSFLYVTDATEYVEWSQKMDGDTLELTFRRKKGLGVLPSGENAYACLIIPKDHHFQTIELEASAGYINAGVLTTGELKIDTEAGAVDMDSAHVQELEIDCEAGAVTFAGAVESKLEADCNVGSVELFLEGKMADFNYEIDANAGSVDIDDQSYSGLKKEKKLLHDGAAKMAELDCSMGSIRVEFNN